MGPHVQCPCHREPQGPRSLSFLQPCGGCRGSLWKTREASPGGSATGKVASLCCGILITRRPGEKPQTAISQIVLRVRGMSGERESSGLKSLGSELGREGLPSRGSPAGPGQAPGHAAPTCLCWRQAPGLGPQQPLSLAVSCSDLSSGFCLPILPTQ